MVVEVLEPLLHVAMLIGQRHPAGGSIAADPEVLSQRRQELIVPWTGSEQLHRHGSYVHHAFALHRTRPSSDDHCVRSAPPAESSVRTSLIVLCAMPERWATSRSPELIVSSSARRIAPRAA